MSMDGILEAFAKLEQLPQETAKRAAPFLERAAKASADAGTTPYGVPWLLTKDGHRALAAASKAISVVSFGTVIELKLSGVEVIHNFGTKLGAARQALQDKSGPEILTIHEKGKRDAASRELAARRKSGNKSVSKKNKAVRTKAQYQGAFHTPARQIIPNPTDPLPESYEKALAEGAGTAFRAAVGGA